MNTHMTSRILGLVCVLAALGSGPGAARADGWYFSEGFGPAKLDGELADHFDATPALAFDVAIGRRIGNFGVQAFLSALSQLEGKGALAGDTFDTLTYGLDARYNLPVAGPLGVYVRGGLEKTNLYGDPFTVEGSEIDYNGRGLHYGAGVRLSGKVRALGFAFWPLFFAGVGPKITAAVWFDANRQIVRLGQPGQPTLDGQITTWKLGFAVGSDF